MATDKFVIDQRGFQMATEDIAVGLLRRGCDAQARCRLFHLT